MFILHLYKLSLLPVSFLLANVFMYANKAQFHWFLSQLLKIQEDLRKTWLSLRCLNFFLRGEMKTAFDDGNDDNDDDNHQNCREGPHRINWNLWICSIIHFIVLVLQFLCVSYLKMTENPTAYKNILKGFCGPWVYKSL